MLGRRLFSAALVAATFALPARAQEPWRAYEGLAYEGLGALEIPFANGPIAMTHVPHVWLGLRGAAPRLFGMDTGRMFLEGFDYLYDAAGGTVGYGWNGRISHEYGGVTPGSS